MQDKYSIAPSPSFVFLPKVDNPPNSILEFLVKRFPNIDKQTWINRINRNLVLDKHKNPISLESQYLPDEKISYFREVMNEKTIQGNEKIIFQNEDIIVVDKPHFLPVTPSGKYVNECLLYRIKNKLNEDNIVPLHRLDMATAGLVMFSRNPQTRTNYSLLFKEHKISKIYEAIGGLPYEENKSEWLIENRLTQSDKTWFLMHSSQDLPINAITKIKILSKNDKYAKYHLEPITGKKHQLRLHISQISSGIVNDKFYPNLFPKEDNNSNPLQLLAKKLSFYDEKREVNMNFESEQVLLTFIK